MSTRERLLAAAIEAFAAEGYEQATIAEICGKAEANIAAVNYHFGSKEKLYAEAWKEAFGEAIRRHPADGGVAAEAPVEERFRGRIQAVIDRIADPECREVDIMAKELANPTGHLHEAIDSAVGPFRRAMVETVGELLGPAVPEETVHMSTMSVMCQCMHLMVMRRRMPIRMAPKGLPPLPPPDKLADHVVKFSLGALAALRREAECVAQEA